MWIRNILAKTKFLLVCVNHNTRVQHNNHHVASHSVVTIPEDLSLSEPEISVLSKGLNFVPVANKSDDFQVKKDAESFFRCTRLKAYFSNSSNTISNDRDMFERLNPSKSSWVPTWRADLYKQEALRQLSDTNFYCEVDKDLTTNNQSLVKATV